MFWLSAREYVSWTWGRAPSLCVEAKLGPWVLPRGEGRQPARVTHATSGILPHFPQKSGSASKAPSLHSQREVAWLGDTQRVSWVWTHLADCQQTWREGKKGRAGEGRGGEGRGWSCGKWSSFKQEMLLHAPSSQQQCLNLHALEELSHPNSYGCDTLLHHKPHIKQAISSKMLTCGESDLTAMSL